MRIKSLLISTMLIISASAAAQQRVAADVEEKTVLDGRVITMTRQIFCQRSGEVASVVERPVPTYTFTNLQGEFKAYFPLSNEVYSDRKDDYSTKDDLFYLFLSGKADDMGLSSYGYRLTASETTDDGLLKRTYVPEKAGQGVSKVEIVLENYLPIYVGYFDGKGRLVSKTYLSSYTRYPTIALPKRVTSIAYTAKRDSTVTRTVYSNIKIDGNEPMFRYQIPADARVRKTLVK